uniref:Uncharacterized protein n=1 Tax=Rhizophora mucronata TaxID=61149 RepID=A0A2P2P251_RHIMU
MLLDHLLQFSGLFLSGFWFFVISNFESSFFLGSLVAAHLLNSKQQEFSTHIIHHIHSCFSMMKIEVANSFVSGVRVFPEDLSTNANSAGSNLI